MPTCDDCDSDVPQAWRRRVFESETRRSIRWLCRACHPAVPSEATETADRESAVGSEPGEARTGSSTTVESSTDTVELRSDGGRSDAGVTVMHASEPTAGERCPVCLSETASDGTLSYCRACRWTGPR